MQNGDPNQSNFRSVTDQNGIASYVFKGVAKGKASITAIAADQNDLPIAVSARDTEVTFATTAPAKKAIKPTITASNSKVSGKATDRLVVKAGAAAPGASYRIARYNANGTVTNITGKLNANSAAVRQIRDLNGSRATRYQVFIAATSKTLAGKSRVISFR